MSSTLHQCPTTASTLKSYNLFYGLPGWRFRPLPSTGTAVGWRNREEAPDRWGGIIGPHRVILARNLTVKQHQLSISVQCGDEYCQFGVLLERAIQPTSHMCKTVSIPFLRLFVHSQRAGRRSVSHGATHHRDDGRRLVCSDSCMLRYFSTLFSTLSSRTEG